MTPPKMMPPKMERSAIHLPELCHHSTRQPRRMASEDDQTYEEIVRLCMKAQQQPRGAARPWHYTQLRGDLVGWLCDWWDMQGKWTTTDHMTHATVLAIEYCDMFHAMDFDEYAGWMWGNTFEERRVKSCCVMYVCAMMARKFASEDLPEKWPLIALSAFQFEGVPESWDPYDMKEDIWMIHWRVRMNFDDSLKDKDGQKAKVVGKKRTRQAQQNGKQWVWDTGSKIWLRVDQGKALERFVLNKLNWRLNVVTTMDVVSTFWARGIFLPENYRDNDGNDWPVTPKFEAVVLKHVNLLMEMSQARGLDCAYGALVCGAEVLICGRILSGLRGILPNVPVQFAAAVELQQAACRDDLLQFWRRLEDMGANLTYHADKVLQEVKRPTSCRHAHYQALWRRQRAVREQLEWLRENDDGLEVCGDCGSVRCGAA